MKIKKIVVSIVISLQMSCSLIFTDSTNPYTKLEEDNLPIIYIHPEPVSHDYYTPVTIIYNGREYEAEGKIRGATSAYYPKKSYTIKFDDSDLFEDSAGNSVTKIVLASNFDDNSYIRNRLAFKVWSDINSNFEINTASRVLYINGEYHGLYTRIDYIGEEFIERNKGLTSQYDYNLYKSKLDDADFSDPDDRNGYEKKLGYPAPGDAGDFTAMSSFITTIQDSTDFDTNFDTVADQASYYDWWFFTSFLHADDSAGKNSYHFQDLTEGSEGKWYYIPWDFNASFGQEYSTERVEPVANDDFIDFNDIFKKIVNNSYFSDQNSPEYKSLMENELSLTSINSYIDDLYDEVSEAAPKDEDKWEFLHQKTMTILGRESDFTTFEEEIEYIREWISQQHALWYEKLGG